MCRSDFVIDRPFFAGYRSQEKPFGRISVFVERWLFQPGLFVSLVIFRFVIAILYVMVVIVSLFKASIALLLGVVACWWPGCFIPVT